MLDHLCKPLYRSLQDGTHIAGQLTSYKVGENNRLPRSWIRQESKRPGCGSVGTIGRLMWRNGPPMVAYSFEDSRGGECVERYLAGFAGILQVDGYAAYNRLARPVGANEGVTRETFDVGVWSVIRLCLHSTSHSARRPSLERKRWRRFRWSDTLGQITRRYNRTPSAAWDDVHAYFATISSGF